MNTVPINHSLQIKNIKWNQNRNKDEIDERNAKMLSKRKMHLKINRKVTKNWLLKQGLRNWKSWLFCLDKTPDFEDEYVYDPEDDVVTSTSTTTTSTVPQTTPTTQLTTSGLDLFQKRPGVSMCHVLITIYPVDFFYKVVKSCWRKRGRKTSSW